MRYIVIEIQSREGSTSTLVNDYADINEAKSKYHSILSAAAISKVPIHSAVIMTDGGNPIKYESYTHPEEEEQNEGM
jgi:hypothetical protein